MPKIVDRDAIRIKIINSFQNCLKEKPFDKITIRDIARNAGIPHTTLLNYYNTRQEIVFAFAEYVADNTFRLGHEWLLTHHYNDFSSAAEYVKSFLKMTMKNTEDTRLIYTGALNIYTSGQTNETLADFVSEEQLLWQNENGKIICQELGATCEESLIGAVLFSCVQSVCMITYNNWMQDSMVDKILDFYTKSILDYLKID